MNVSGSSAVREGHAFSQATPSLSRPLLVLAWWSGLLRLKLVTSVPEVLFLAFGRPTPCG
jgi:hypothetical protein